MTSILVEISFPLPPFPSFHCFQDLWDHLKVSPPHYESYEAACAAVADIEAAQAAAAASGLAAVEEEEEEEEGDGLDDGGSGGEEEGDEEDEEEGGEADEDDEGCVLRGALTRGRRMGSCLPAPALPPLQSARRSRVSATMRRGREGGGAPPRLLSLPWWRSCSLSPDRHARGAPHTLPAVPAHCLT